MTPGYIDRIRRGSCPECHGWDMGGIGSIHHAVTCSRNQYCALCGLELLPKERRAPGIPNRHLDCEIDREEDHAEERHAELP